MSQIVADHADGCALAVPHGWVSHTPEPADDSAGTPAQVITVADWDDARGLRPTMTVHVVRASEDDAAVRVLAAAQAGLRDPHVISIDPWRVPESDLTGRRLVFAHTDGDITLCTLVWVVRTPSLEVTVSAHVETMQLHEHDQAFAEAVAGIRLPGEARSGVPEPPGTADLARRAAAPVWADVAPGSDGPLTGMVSDPDARVLVEASVDSLSLRFDVTLARDEATITATASPREVVRRREAGLEVDAGVGSTSRFRIPVTRLALAVAQWLGLGPAWTHVSRPVTVPLALVMNRLVDPSVPAPAGIDPDTWQQPWFLWTLRSSATDSGLVMVDTGTSGQCAVMETEDERATRFAPLSSYNVWLTLNWLISESLPRD